MWHVTVMKALGPGLVNKVNGITLERGKLTVVADSSAWASRMRYALADIEPALREVAPDFQELVIRVRPRRAT
jgi:hypothetical protein